MMTPDEFIEGFLATATELQKRPDLSAELVAGWVVAAYRRVRIEDTVLEDDGDMLLIQAGAMRLFDVDGPTDWRDVGDDQITQSAQTHLYVDVTRQIIVTGTEDDTILQFSLTLDYGPIDEDVADASCWICTPDDLDQQLQEILEAPLVSDLWPREPVRLLAIVQRCG